MLKHSYKVIALAIILTVSAVAVSAGTASSTIVFEVPFDFQIGNEKFEKGEYRVKRENQNAILVESLDGEESTIILAGASSARLDAFTQSQLTFYRYGKTHFLREIKSPGISAEIRESKDEKSVIKQGYEKLAKVTVKGSRKKAK
ncbi:MAG: hypothetical protein DWQ47_15380 [Acidobacteria bacterium]|nr:MAG: hypothetical protein DWQ32_02780 [Acidobacteriota bacterium]REK02556.1 MAG: hypothetical protein DWQ38_09355 [Acidobacteriota bacterium]REK13641.1 MAG: hypothetical protein DWQ43_08470 [Acidobacteriota bacterium]REK41635.1 MAG: hypothetical protein DWQ47_15380 [Acidobacteriota bacterium]